MKSCRMNEDPSWRLEKSITGQFKNIIWKPFIKGISRYGLINDGDRIGVCVSGGKDSMLLAKLMQMLSLYGIYNIEPEFIMMNPGFSKETLDSIKHNSELLGISLYIFDTDVLNDVKEIGKDRCFFCSRMRRGYLYRQAKKLGLNKIALGHHYDDVVETILMSMLYGSQIETMLPLINSSSVEDMELIRPMYLIKEDAVVQWQTYGGLYFEKCSCVIGNKDKDISAARYEVKELIRDLMAGNPHVKSNIFGSVQNVDLNKIMSYKLNGRIYKSFGKEPD